MRGGSNGTSNNSGTVVRSVGHGHGNTCLVPTCIQLSATLLQNMNITVDPGEDFYEYACRGWGKIHQILDDKARYGAFSQLYDSNQITLKSVLRGTSADAAKKLGTTQAPT